MRAAGQVAATPSPSFVEGSMAVHREYGLVDVLAVVGPQRLIRVQAGRSPSEIAVLAVHVDELAPAGRAGGAPQA
jgi:hypothetical protein